MIHHALFTGRANLTQEAVNGDPQPALIFFEPGVYGSKSSAPSGSLPEGVELDFQALGKQTISIRQGGQAEASGVQFIRNSQQTVE